MSDGKEQGATAERFLELLQNVRPVGEGFSALCSAHDDNNNSLSVGETPDGTVLMKCFAGCETADIIAALGLDWKDFFAGSNGQRTIGVTLEDYAKEKALPLSFLQKLGITQIYLGKLPVVRIPYLDPTGVPLAVRMRVSLNGETKFRWKTGSKPILYGLSRLSQYRKKYIFLCEGESDAQTLWFHGIQAMGIPGAATWNEVWAEYLDPFERLYIIIEPDKGGEAVLKWLAKSKIRDRAFLVTLPDAKDPSELYLRDPAKFGTAMKAAAKAAVPWTERELAENRARRKAAWQKCKSLAKKEDILEELAQALAKRGVAGERRASKTVFLAMNSRLSRPVSIVLTGPSSSGKSFTAQQVLEFFPASSYYALTAMSERALAYSTEPLKHRFLVLYEAPALDSEFLNYVIRSLLSEGHLRYETVEKTPEGMQSRLIEREGPTGLLLTTTAVSLHPENETRHFVLTVSDSPAQTKRILSAIAAQHTGNDNQSATSVDMNEWHALQEWLQLADHEVVIPYASAIAELIPPVAVRLRRDFKAVLNLIVANAILHQATRSRDDKRRIIAKLRDYAVVRDLVNHVVSQSVEQTIPKTIRQTVEVVGRICSKKEEDERRISNEPITATIKEVAKKLGLDRSAASRRVSKSLHGGYLKNLESNRGQPKRLAIGDAMPNEQSVLPTPEEVKAQWKRMRQS